jgi:RHS repeat-associated protein
MPPPGAGSATLRFTGEERDNTALDYFGARFYFMQTGRFTTVDPVFSNSIGNPQKWNRYAYARNNPLRLIDPSGTDDMYVEPEAPLVADPGSLLRARLRLEEFAFDYYYDRFLSSQPLPTDNSFESPGCIPFCDQSPGTPTTPSPASPSPLIDRTLKIFADISAGAGDVLSFGVTEKIRIAYGTDLMDRSPAYVAGAVAGTANSLLVGGYALGAEGAGARAFKATFGMNDYLRIGWSWFGQEGAEAVRIYRVAVGSTRSAIHAHLDLTVKPAGQAVVDFLRQLGTIR